MGGHAMTTQQDFDSVVAKLGDEFASRAAEHDDRDEFVSENYDAMRKHRIFSAVVPQELGGLGISHRQMSRALRTLGRCCGSTALSLSMHQHLVGAQVWNYKHGRPGQKLLEKVAKEECVLVSTGANDWLASSGQVVRVDGGYRVSAKKAFASGSPHGHILMTSAPYEDPKEGWQVFHFPVPLSAEGVHIETDWRTLGMRGTGSNTVTLKDVFVPEEAVALRRPRGRFHPVFSIITTVALPYIASVYVGVAEAAASIARERAKQRPNDGVLPYLLGEMENSLTTAQIAVDSMVERANDFDFEPVVENANAALMRKTIATRAAIDTVEKALEASGGAGYFRSMGLERLLRDVHAGQFHPLPEKRQELFTGRLAMGLDPVAEAG